MGDNTLASRSNGTVVTASWVNDLRTALLINHLPRNASGVVEASAGSLGSVDYPWAGCYADSATIGGVAIDPNRLGARPHRIVSGAAKTSGYPQFLTAAGVGNGLSASLLAATTDLRLVVNSESVTVTADQSYAGLTAAPSSNNTCLIDDTSLAGAASTKLYGEYGRGFIVIDTIGSGISALNGQYGAFLKGSEVFLARIDTTNGRLYPVYRGWAGTTRETLSNNDTITLLKLSTLLMSSDGSTKVATTYFPESVTTSPAAATAGKVYIERQTGKHGYDTGSEISYDYVILGWAICNSADCKWVQPYDFDLAWNEEANFDYVISATTEITVKVGSFAWVGSAECAFTTDISATQASNMDSGETIAADTDFYIYLKHDGGVVFSTIAPRLYSFLVRGSYHPQNYYRCVGVVRTDGSSLFKSYRGSRMTAEKLADGMVPIGAIVPFLPGYFDSAGNVSYAAINGNTAAAVNSQLPANWRVCDGTALVDRESPIYSWTTRYLPDLTDDRFLMGDTAAGTATAAATHTHNIAHAHKWAYFSVTEDLHTLNALDDTVTNITGSNEMIIEQRANAATTGSQDFADVPATTDQHFYTTGVLSPPSGAAGATAASGTNSADVTPKHLTCFFIMRVK